MLILGIDPGITGALALLLDDLGTKLLAVGDMPSRKEGNKSRVDVGQLQALLHVWESDFGDIDLAAIEKVGAVPRDSAVTAFSFGHAVGSLVACVELTLPRAEIELIGPQRWRNALPFKIPTGEKATIGQVASALGSAPGTFTGPRGGLRQGRIDAALIGLSAARLKGL